MYSIFNCRCCGVLRAQGAANKHTPHTSAHESYYSQNAFIILVLLTDLTDKIDVECQFFYFF